MARRIPLPTLTESELKAVLWAVSQMTGGNARDINEMMLCGMTLAEAKALLRAEAYLEGALTPLVRA